MNKTFTLYTCHLNSGLSGGVTLAREYNKGNSDVSKFSCDGKDEDIAYKTLVKAARQSVKFTWTNHMSHFMKKNKSI